MKKTWKVPCTWTMGGHLFIEADTAEQAVEIAEGPDIGLPDDKEYIGDFTVFEQEIEELFTPATSPDLPALGDSSSATHAFAEDTGACLCGAVWHPQAPAAPCPLDPPQRKGE